MMSLKLILHSLICNIRIMPQYKSIYSYSFFFFFLYFCCLYIWLYYKPLDTLWSFFPSTFYYLLRKSKRDKIMSFVFIHIFIISKYSFLSRGFGFPFGVTLSLFEGHLLVFLMVQNYSFQIL